MNSLIVPNGVMDLHSISYYSYNMMDTCNGDIIMNIAYILYYLLLDAFLFATLIVILNEDDTRIVYIIFQV